MKAEKEVFNESSGGERRVAAVSVFFSVVVGWESVGCVLFVVWCANTARFANQG